MAGARRRFLTVSLVLRCTDSSWCQILLSLQFLVLFPPLVARALGPQQGGNRTTFQPPYKKQRKVVLFPPLLEMDRYPNKGGIGQVFGVIGMRGAHLGVRNRAGSCWASVGVARRSTPRRHRVSRRDSCRHHLLTGFEWCKPGF